MKRIIFVAGVLALAGCGSSTPPGVDCVANPTDPSCQSDGGPGDAGQDAGPGDAGCGAELAACDGGVCEAGVCTSACAVGGSVVPEGNLDPNNPCVSCQPGVSSTAYSPLPDATSCNADGQHFCLSGTCIPACNIPSVGVVATGVAKADNPCLTCQPQVNAVDYSNAANGTACNSNGGDVCFNGGCDLGCFIAGSLHAVNEMNGPCQKCDPAAAVDAWSNLADGMQCGCGPGGPGGAQIVTSQCSAGTCQTCAGCSSGAPPCCGGCNTSLQCNNPPPPLCN